MTLSPLGPVQFSSHQHFYVQLAQRVFIANMILNFPLYYLPPFNRWCGGDGQLARFPCSISWMTRKGLPRYLTLCTWIPGWMLLLYAYHSHEGDNRFGLQIFGLSMFAAGFVTVVLTPIQEDVAMGSRDTIHCVAASVYIVYHFLANEWVLGVDCFTGSNVYGLTFTTNSVLCCFCQFLRMDGNRKARVLYQHLIGGSGRKHLPTFQQFVLGIEYAFQLTENLLFLAFLLGMTSGRAMR
eukprot:TRINITY_DN108876_c0_g1_i1.p1 TRINITY_DN108876_c0_g1~~TRINITY_DN108876_c0_g1_i1.p1  ORF type:complete len:239 (-),score=7.68 TRINITY_DN108876_c0_g1_i1:111-827(-)